MATQTRPNKRPNTTVTPTTTVNRTSPTEQGKLHLSNTLQSLPSTLSQFLTKPCEDILILFGQLIHRHKVLADLTKGEKIPASARFKFKLTSTPSVCMTESFKTLALETDTLIKAFQDSLVIKIKAVKELELLDTRNTIITKLIETAIVYTKGYFIHSTPLPCSPGLLRSTVASFLLSPSLKIHLRLRPDDDVDPIIQEKLDAALGNTTAEHLDNLTTNLIQNLHKDLNSLFTATFDTFTEALHKSEKEKKLFDLLKTFEKDNATTHAATFADMEPTLPPEQLSELINKQVDQQTKKLRQQIASLQKQSKNLPRGATTTPGNTSASEKKKTTKAVEDLPKVVESNKDSTKNKEETKKPKSKNKSTLKKTKQKKTKNDKKSSSTKE